MHAWVVATPKPVTEQPLLAVELPLPVPGPGQVRIRVEACGVCHTDVHIAEGDLDLHRIPVVPGHQVVGMIDALGAGVVNLHPGERLGVTWLAYACGQCEFCYAGRENLCPEAQFTGYDVDGGYAEYAVAQARFAVRLPEGMTPVAAAPLLCAGVIGYRSLCVAGVQPGQRVGLIGFGASAHLALQVARYWGCAVYVFTRSAHHRRQALALGAVWAGGLENTPPADCHSQVLFAPAGTLVPQCLRHLRKGGTLAINAVHMSDLPAMPYALLFGERTLRSVSNVTRQDATEFLALAHTIPVQAQTRAYPFAEANAALMAVKRAEIAGAAVLTLGVRRTDEPIWPGGKGPE